MSPQTIDRLIAIAQRLADFLKWIVAGALVRRATQIEERAAEKDHENKIRKKQQEIAGRPSSRVAALLERMRREEL